jgi:hypothetical protein
MPRSSLLRDGIVLHHLQFAVGAKTESGAGGEAGPRTSLSVSFQQIISPQAVFNFTGCAFRDEAGMSAFTSPAVSLSAGAAYSGVAAEVETAKSTAVI